MKKYICVLILQFGIFLSTKAQETYHIVHVSGKVTNLSTTKEIKIGDKIMSTHQLKFGSKTSKLIGLHPQKGRTVFSPTATAKENELVFYAKNVLTPAQEINRLSTRETNLGTPLADTTKSPVYSIDAIFGSESRYYVIGKQEKITLKDPTFPSEDTELHLYYYFEHQGIEVYRPIHIVNEKLVLNEHNFYTFDRNEKIDIERIKNVKLVKRNEDTEEYEEVMKIQPIVFLNEKNILEELKEYKKEALATTPTKKLFDELEGYFMVTYGNTNRDALKAFLVKHKVL